MQLLLFEKKPEYDMFKCKFEKYKFKVQYEQW